MIATAVYPAFRKTLLGTIYSIYAYYMRTVQSNFLKSYNIHIYIYYKENFVIVAGYVTEDDAAINCYQRIRIMFLFKLNGVCDCNDNFFLFFMDPNRILYSKSGSTLCISFQTSDVMSVLESDAIIRT